MNAAREFIMLENFINADGLRVAHLMSNTPPSDLPQIKEQFGEGEIKRENGVWHFRSSAPVRGLVEIKCEGWVMPKMFVAWSLQGCASVTAALRDAAICFERSFGFRAGYAFMRTLPRGVESGVEVDDLMLFDAEWMIGKCVAVGWKMKESGK